MKKILLSFTVLATLALSAQPVLDVTLDSPQAGSTLTSGGTFQWDITIANTGNAIHNTPANGDTCIYYPTVDGLLISVNGVTQAFIIADPIPAGQSITRTRSYIFSGGTSATWNVCGRIQVSGTSYAGVVNDSSCVDITYNAMSTGDLVIASYADESYYSNSVYHVKVLAANKMLRPTFEMVDISGRTVKQVNLESDGLNVDQEVYVGDLPAGVYFVRLSTASEFISVNKMLKQ
jgi:hypothetical protein